MANTNRHLTKGFTLIEALIYLGLFGLVMAGVITTAYNIFELSGRTQARDMLTAEGNFLLGKINWAMNGATAISVVSSPPSLVITRDLIPTTVTFDLTGGTTMELKRGSNAAVGLNNSNVQVQNLVFTHTGSGTNPENMTAAFNLTANTPDGKQLTQSFSTTEYLHK